MIIANQLEKTNIAEYILYMFQVEDLIRANDLSMLKLKQNIISKFKQPKNIIEKIEHWYEGLIDLMKIEKIEKRGHLNFVKLKLTDLNTIHLLIIKENKDTQYLQTYNIALGNIELFKHKTGKENLNNIEICFNALYGFLLLKLKNKSVSKLTEESMKSFSNLLNQLAQKYHKNKIRK